MPTTVAPQTELFGDTSLPGVTQPPPAPNFGPVVPDATQQGTTTDAPPALFNEQNMSPERTGEFLGGYADLAPDIDRRETVQGQLEDVLNQDNALFDYARGQATQYANTRGLVNSDIAAEAGAQAVFQNALPIAQQDAATWNKRMTQEREFFLNSGLRAFDATIQSGLMAQDHLQQLVQLTHQGDINSRLQLEQFGYNWNLNEQQNIHTMQQLALQGDIQSELALQEFGFDVELMRQDYDYRIGLMDIELRNALNIDAQQHDNRLAELDAQHQNTLEQMDINNQARLDEIAAQGDEQAQLDAERFSRDLQQNYLNAVERRTGLFTAEVQTIYTTQGLTSAQQTQAVDRAYERYLNDLDFIAATYASSPVWDPSWIVSPTQITNDPNIPGDGPEPGGPPVPDEVIPPPPPAPLPDDGAPPEPGDPGYDQYVEDRRDEREDDYGRAQRR